MLSSAILRYLYPSIKYSWITNTQSRPTPEFDGSIFYGGAFRMATFESPYIRLRVFSINIPNAISTLTASKYAESRKHECRKFVAPKLRITENYAAPFSMCNLS